MASYSDSIQVKSFSFQRDPSLPPPEVCDWLLAQNWPGPSRVNMQSNGGAECIEECCIARGSIGRDGMIDLLLPQADLETLREDARARAAIAWLRDQEAQRECN